MYHNSFAQFEDGECCVAIYHGPFDASFQTAYINLPCYPEEVQNSVEATWNSQTIIGRTGTINTYVGTSDIITNFSFDLHREMPVNNSNN